MKGDRKAKRSETTAKRGSDLHLHESTSPHRQEALQILLNLKIGKAVSNAQFDIILPAEVRQLSLRYWTPVNVAIRAAELLVNGPNVRVLDVGSGPGKFCIIGALTTKGTFVGVEQTSSLVGVAQRTARVLRVPRVSFVHDNMTALDWSRYDSFYLFNPFYEKVKASTSPDQNSFIKEPRFDHYVKIVEDKLAHLRLGSRVVTYHGFGGSFPPSFRKLLSEPFGGDFIELWVKELEEKTSKPEFNTPAVTSRRQGYWIN